MMQRLDIALDGEVQAVEVQILQLKDVEETQQLFDNAHQCLEQFRTVLKQATVARRLSDAQLAECRLSLQARSEQLEGLMQEAKRTMQNNRTLSKISGPIEIPDLESVSPAVLSRYLHMLFQLGDRNNDGKLDLEEFADLLSRSGMNFPEHTIKRIMVHGDASDDGKIDFKDFVPVMVSLLNKPTAAPPKGDSLPELHTVSTKVLEQYLHKLFDVGDTDKDGMLTLNEMTHLLVHAGLDFSWQVIRKIVEAADLNHDGLIDWSEFVPAMLQVIRAHNKQESQPPSQLPASSQEGYHGMLAVRDAMAAGIAHTALDAILDAKEDDLIRSFLRDDVWLANALPRGAHLFNHMPDENHELPPPHCKPGRDLTMLHNELPDLEAELDTLQQRRAAHDRVRQLFDLLDSNADLQLSHQECAVAIGSELASRIVSRMDSDKDGKVSLTEWMGFFADMAAKAELQGIRGDVYFRQVNAFVATMCHRVQRRQAQ